MFLAPTNLPYGTLAKKHPMPTEGDPCRHRSSVSLCWWLVAESLPHVTSSSQIVIVTRYVSPSENAGNRACTHRQYFRDANPSVFQRRHIGRLLRSRTIIPDSIVMQSRTSTMPMPPLWPGDLQDDGRSLAAGGAKREARPDLDGAPLVYPSHGQSTQQRSTSWRAPLTASIGTRNSRAGM